MISYASGGKESFKGKKVSISGSGNVAQYAALKVIELGGTVISLSDSKGTIIATKDSGITPAEVNFIADLKVKRKQLTELSSSAEHKDSFKYIDGQRPWKNVEKVDVALPCATQNEVSGDEAEALISAGAKFIAEGSNMGCSQDAIDVFEKHRKEKKAEAIWYAPGKTHSFQFHVPYSNTAFPIHRRSIELLSYLPLLFQNIPFTSLHSRHIPNSHPPSTQQHCPLTHFPTNPPPF